MINARARQYLMLSEKSIFISFSSDYNVDISI